MAVGHKLKELRESRGWSQDHVAERMGMHRANVSNYERSKNKSISGQNLKRFADLFEVSSDYLLGKTENPEQVIPPEIVRLELSDDADLEKVVFVLDGKELTREEILITIAFLRTIRQLKK